MVCYESLVQMIGFEIVVMMLVELSAFVLVPEGHTSLLQSSVAVWDPMEDQQKNQQRFSLLYLSVWVVLVDVQEDAR